MPLKYSRYRIKILDKSFQNIKDITVRDLWDEGLNFPEYYTEDIAIDCFRQIWDKCYKEQKYKFDSNPEVIVYTFKLLLPEEI